jgi:hypothetical protein
MPSEVQGVCGLVLQNSEATVLLKFAVFLWFSSPCSTMPHTASADTIEFSLYATEL